MLDQLDTHNAKATFFCIGDNVAKHPTIFNKLIAAFHRIGNHTFSHCNCWKTSLESYTKDIEKCAAVLENHLPGLVPLFRPPYGRITPKQIRVLQDKSYEIIMWSVLSKDYDYSISGK